MGQKKFSGPPSPPRVDPKTPKNGQNRVFQNFLQTFFVDLAKFLPEGKTNWDSSDDGSKNFFGSAGSAPVGPKTPKNGQIMVFRDFHQNFFTDLSNFFSEDIFALLIYCNWPVSELVVFKLRELLCWSWDNWALGSSWAVLNFSWASQPRFWLVTRWDLQNRSNDFFETLRVGRPSKMMNGSTAGFLKKIPAVTWHAQIW